ncbi:BBP/SF1 family protein, partial [Kipferlia bialata]
KGSSKTGRQRKDGQEDSGEGDDLHVRLEGLTRDELLKAVEVINNILTYKDDDDNIHKQIQLRKLAMINGTLKEGDSDALLAQLAGTSKPAHLPGHDEDVDDFLNELGGGDAAAPKPKAPTTNVRADELDDEGEGSDAMSDLSDTPPWRMGQQGRMQYNQGMFQAPMSNFRPHPQQMGMYQQPPQYQQMRPQQGMMGMQGGMPPQMGMGQGPPQGMMQGGMQGGMGQGGMQGGMGRMPPQQGMMQQNMPPQYQQGSAPPQRQPPQGMMQAPQGMMPPQQNMMQQ